MNKKDFMKKNSILNMVDIERTQNAFFLYRCNLIGIAGGILLLDCVATICAVFLFVEYGKARSMTSGMMKSVSDILLCAIIFAFGLRLLVERFICDRNPKKISEITLFCGYFFIITFVIFMTLQTFSAEFGISVSLRTLILLTVMTTFLSSIISEIILNIIMCKAEGDTNKDDILENDDKKTNVVMDRYTFWVHMKKEYALLLDEDEYQDFLKCYNAYMEKITPYINTIDVRWGEVINTSRLFINKDLNGLNLTECSFMPSHLDSGRSLFSFTEYPADEYQCEQLINSDGKEYWRNFKGNTVIALYVPEDKYLISEQEFEKTFKDVLDRYLPDNFNYFEHMGFIRIYDCVEHGWNFKRRDAESYFKHLRNNNLSEKKNCEETN